MAHPTLYRRRFIPDELVCLKNDCIVAYDDNRIVTHWETLKLRKDFAYGCSCYFLKEGFKVSRFMTENGQLLYYYCDIIQSLFNPKKNEWVFNDLLVDVVVYENGFVKVMDLAELPEAAAKGLITSAMMHEALLRTDALLQIIYDGQFHTLTQYLETND